MPSDTDKTTAAHIVGAPAIKRLMQSSFVAVHLSASDAAVDEVMAWTGGSDPDAAWEGLNCALHILAGLRPDKADLGSGKMTAPLVSIIARMVAEYDRDEECDGAKLNALIEEAGHILGQRLGGWDRVVDLGRNLDEAHGRKSETAPPLLITGQMENQIRNPRPLGLVKGGAT